MAAANVGAAESLFRQAARCKRCPRMAKRSAVLGTTCGPLSAEVLFVGEAPGRLGADRSRVPFRGDRSGDNFDRLLRHVGLSRGEVFVTNAVLCCPVADGRNARPSTAEVANCSTFLRRTIELVSPVVVATLGAVALDAVGGLLGSGLRLSEVVGCPIQWGQRLVVPLYHPSPRVMSSRRTLAQQLHDIEVVARALELGRRTAASRSA
ncbi:MAG: uracil-DNA glycosylase [Planctomycetota bacterium]|jgi:DNA polymerase